MKKPAHIIKTLLIVIIFTLSACSTEVNKSINLSGEWSFKMDPNDKGELEKWYLNEFDESVNLPGSMVENDKGFNITFNTKWTGSIRDKNWYKNSKFAPYTDSSNVLIPFWLQPNKKYTGAAWYAKEVQLPEDWESKNIRLVLERPHFTSTVWVNGTKLKSQNSLAVPHVFEVTNYLKVGANKLVVRIDNRTVEMDPGENSHSITDHTQTNWNGIVGKILLQEESNVFIEHVELFPDIESKSVRIKAKINNTKGELVDAKISFVARLKKDGDKSEKQKEEVSLNTGISDQEFVYPLGDKALLWDEFNPNVYELFIELQAGGETDLVAVDFGLRRFYVEDQMLKINGRHIFLRGTLECAIFPLTGYPATGTEYWKKIYTAVKDHGLNHVRFHSWCPPEAAFIVADKMGVYLQVECSTWPNSSTKLGNGFPIDQYIWDESKRIVAEYGNHPSFVMLTSGNEPSRPNIKEYLAEFVNYWKETDSRRIYTSAAGWPIIPENDFHLTHNKVRILWGEELQIMINSKAPQTDYDWTDGIKELKAPLVSHEIGQWCVYPNFKEIKKYTGVLQAKNFEIFRKSLDAHNMLHLADSFLLASGKLQALCYKADIEVALRTPGFGGFQLLDLHDFPGQGTALVGVLDAFWEEKGYISPEEYRRFCNSTVPLARLKKRIFIEGEIMTASIELAHFGDTPMNRVNPTWTITYKNEVVAKGSLEQRNIPIGNAIKLGNVVYEFPKDKQAKKMTLEVDVKGFKNSWDIWVYPENQLTKAENTMVVQKLDKATINHLEKGGKLLLSLGKGKVATDKGGEVGVGFSSIFWNTAWTQNQKPHTLGILCNPNHPALAQFPTEYHSNWQWWDAMSHADAIRLDDFSNTPDPIVRIIDDWFTNRPLAIVFEAKVGKGSIIVSGVDLISDLENRPEGRQLKTSLLSYMQSDSFVPQTELSVVEIKSLLK